MFKFGLRTAVGNLGFLPKVHYTMDPTGKSLVVACSWGSPDLAVEIADHISAEINQPSRTSDETQIRGAKTTLPTPDEKIREAFEKAHNIVLKSNADEYKEGLEVLVLQESGQQIYFAHVGGPQIFSMSSQGDMQLMVASASLHSKSSDLAPLPSLLLGVEKSMDLSIGHFAVDSIRSLVLSSQPIIPKKLLTAKSLDLQKLVEVYTHHNAEAPFWVGFLELI